MLAVTGASLSKAVTICPPVYEVAKQPFTTKVLRERINDKLFHVRTLGGAVQMLYEAVPAHLVPADESFTKSSIILDAQCFGMVVQRMVPNSGAPPRVVRELFDEIDTGATGLVSLLDVARRVRSKEGARTSMVFFSNVEDPDEDELQLLEERAQFSASSGAQPPRARRTPRARLARPKVTMAEVQCALATVQGKLQQCATSDTHMLPSIVRLFEKGYTHGAADETRTIATRNKSKKQCLNPAEFHQLLHEMLHISVTREVSDSLFALLMGQEIHSAWSGGQMSVAQFVEKVMPPSYSEASWQELREAEMKLQAEGRKGKAFNQFYASESAAAHDREISRGTANDVLHLRVRVADQLAAHANSDSHLLQTMVTIFARQGEQHVVHGRHVISRDEFHRVLTRVLMIPCTSMEASQLFTWYKKDKDEILSLAEFVHQSMPPEYTRAQWNVKRELILEKGHHQDSTTGWSHKKHSQKCNAETKAMGQMLGTVDTGAADDANARYHGRRNFAHKAEGVFGADPVPLVGGRDLMQAHGIEELKHAVKQRLSAHLVESLDSINHISRLFLQTVDPSGGRSGGGSIMDKADQYGDGSSPTARRVALNKDQFFYMVSERLHVFCARGDVDAYFKMIAGGGAELTPMRFAEEVFGAKKHDPQLLIARKNKTIMNRAVTSASNASGRPKTTAAAVQQPPPPLQNSSCSKLDEPRAPETAAVVASPTVAGHVMRSSSSYAVSTADSNYSRSSLALARRNQPRPPSGPGQVRAVTCAQPNRPPRSKPTSSFDIPKHLLFRALKHSANTAQ